MTARGRCSCIQAPVKPKTAVGKMLNYYLKMEPHLFRAAIDEQFARIRSELDEKEKQEQELEQAETKEQTSKSEIVLYRFALLLCILQRCT